MEKGFRILLFTIGVVLLIIAATTLFILDLPTTVKGVTFTLVIYNFAYIVVGLLGLLCLSVSIKSYE